MLFSLQRSAVFQWPWPPDGVLVLDACRTGLTSDETNADTQSGCAECLTGIGFVRDVSNLLCVAAFAVHVGLFNEISNHFFAH